MSRPSKTTDFRVSVESVGDFVFAKRTMHDEIKVQVEFARMIDGVEPTQWLQVVCGALADLRTLTVSAPAGWDLETLDPLDSDSYANLVRVHEALVAKERSFRLPAKSAVEGSGAGVVGDN